jgi:hypothetical protein
VGARGGVRAQAGALKSGEGAGTYFLVLTRVGEAFSDIDTLKRSVGMIDTVIGGSTAILIKRLFTTPHRAKQRRPKSS